MKRQLMSVVLLAFAAATGCDQPPEESGEESVDVRQSAATAGPVWHYAFTGPLVYVVSDVYVVRSDGTRFSVTSCPAWAPSGGSCTSSNIGTRCYTNVRRTYVANRSAPVADVYKCF